MFTQERSRPTIDPHLATDGYPLPLCFFLPTKLEQAILLLERCDYEGFLCKGI